MMKLSSAFYGLLALVPSCLAITETEAMQLVYYYTAYDLDVKVWGQGNGYIAPGCEGVIWEDSRCSFDEFINFIVFGDAASEPSYYELQSNWYFVIGDTTAMVTALMAIDELRSGYQNSIVKGREGTVGLFQDLAKINDMNYSRAQSRGIGISRHWGNIEKALGGLRVYLSAAQDGSLLDRLRSWNQDVVWEIVNHESEYKSAGWNSVDWEATLEANPDLRNPSSTLFLNTIDELKGANSRRGNMVDKSVAAKVANQLKDCFGK